MTARLFHRLAAAPSEAPSPSGGNEVASPAPTRPRRLAAVFGVAQVALMALLLAGGAFATAAISGPSASDASCNGWPSSGGVPPTGHAYLDYSSGSSTWSDGDMKVRLPSSYTCSGWIRTYSYNAVQTLTHAHYYWMRMMTAAGGSTNCNYAGSGTDYMRQDGCGTANFPMASGAGLSQNTNYTNFGIAYASCSTDYGAHVGWTSSSSPGANCGSPAERTPDGTSPKFDWTDPTSPALAITPGANSSLNGTTLFVKGTVAGSFTSAASGGTDSGGSGLAGYMHTLSGSTAGWSPASSLTASQIFSWSGLAEGQSATLSVISRDGAGNGSAAVTRTLVADNSGPTLSASVPSAFSGSSSVTLTMGASDAASGVANYALYRYSAPPSGQGTCPVPTSGAPWTSYGAVTSGGAGSFSGRTFTDSGLADGTCYYWSFQSNDAVANWAGISTGAVLVDLTKPTVTILRLQPASDTGTSSTDNLTNATSLVYDLAFSEPVSGVAASDLSVSGTATGCTVGAPAGSGTTYTVTLTGCSAGTVNLTFAANGATDVASNTGPASAVSAAAVTVDRTPPGASFSAVPSSPTGATSLGYAVTFTEPVTGLTAPDFTVTGTASGWTVSPTIIGSGAGPYTLGLTGGGEGTVVLNLAGSAVTDSAGNPGPASAVSAATITVDRAAPTVTALHLQAASDSGASSTDGVTNAASLVYDLAFGEPVTGVAASDLSATGTAMGCTVGAPAGSGATYTVTLTGCSDGTVTLTFAANGATDIASNTGPSSAVSAATVTVDRTAPTATFSTVPSTTTAATNLGYAVTFSEGVTGLTPSDFTITGTATGWTVGTPAGSGPGPYTFSVTNGGQGTVVVTLVGGAVTDAAGNSGPASAVSAATITVDRAAPTLTTLDLQAASDSGASSTDNLTNASSLVYDLAFSKPVTGVAASDLSVTGTAVGCTVGAPAGSGATYTVTLTGCSDGTVTLTFAANGATDIASNTGPSSAVSAATVTVDRTAPTPPDAPILDAPSDSGNLGDNNTNVTTPTLVGTAEPGSVVAVAVDEAPAGEGSADPSSGTWRIALTSGLADGIHLITASATDLAGNVSASSVGLSIAIDTVPPLAPSTPVLDPGSDSDVLGDNTTSITTPTFTGTAEPGSTGSVLSGGLVAGTALTDPITGAWQVAVTSPLTLGAHEITARAEDVAGNVGIASPPLAITIVASEVHIVAPAANATLFATEAISAATSGSPVASVDFYVDGVKIGSDTTAPFEVDWDTTASNGSHKLSAVSTLVDGSTVTSAEVAVSVDNGLSTPERLSADLASGRLSTDDYSLDGVYAAVTPVLLPARYQTASGGAMGDASVDAYIANWTNLSLATQTAINDVIDQPLRGSFFNETVDGSTKQATTIAGNPDTCQHVEKPYYGVVVASKDDCEYDTAHFAISYVMNGWVSPGWSDQTYAEDSVGPQLGSSGRPLVVEQYADGLESAYRAYDTDLGYGAAWQTLIPVSIHHLDCGRCGQVLISLNPLDWITNHPNTIEMAPDVGSRYYLAHHEAFHEFQYRFLNPALVTWMGGGTDHIPAFRWLAESTADWAAGEVTRLGYPGDLDAYPHELPEFLSRPNAPLDVFDGGVAGHQYGAFIFDEFLAETVSSPSVIHEIWSEISGHPGYPLDAIANVLSRDHSLDLADLLPTFWRQNYFLAYDDHGVTVFPSPGTFPSDIESAWRPTLINPNYPTLAADDHGPARPTRDPIPMSPGTPQSSSAWVSPGGAQYFDLVPPQGGVSGMFSLTIDATAAQNLFPGPDLKVEAVSVSYPTDTSIAPHVCDDTGIIPLTAGVGSAVLTTDPACRYAVLIVTNDRAGGSNPEQLRFTATFDTGTRFDDFARTVTNGWGAATPGGASYTTMTYSGSGSLSVSNGSGVIASDPVGPGMDYYLGSSLSAKVSPARGEMSGDFDMVTEFEIDSLASNPLMYISFFSGGSWQTEADISFGTYGEVFFWGHHPGTAKTDWQTGTRYEMRLRRVAATGVTSVRVWKAGEAEPSTWMATTTIAGTPDTFEVGLHNYSKTDTTNATISLSVHAITFDSPPQP